MRNVSRQEAASFCDQTSKASTVHDQHVTKLELPIRPPPVRQYVEEGNTYFLEMDEQPPLTFLKNLGHGHSARMEMVQDPKSGRVFARKVFSCYASYKQRQRIYYSFTNEMAIIRRLRHHHFVRVHAAYVAKRELSLVLNPVASHGDLSSFLQDLQERRTTVSDLRILSSAFGCLGSGLAYMHAKKIRHKDIKPSNISLHEGLVLYTDFSYSLDHSAAEGSTTTGVPNALTEKYCAPEVSEWKKRNEKSD